MWIVRPADRESAPAGVPTRYLVRDLQATRGKALNVQEPAPQEQRRPRRVGLLFGVAGAVFVVDVITTIIVAATLTPGHPVKVIGTLLTLELVRNGGAAFSFGPGMTILFTLIAVGVIVFIVRTSRRLHSLAWAVTLGLLFGGAAGNLTDRLLRSPGVFRGEVVDWVQLPHWPVFNVADAGIVCGGILAVVVAARGIRLDGTREVRVTRGEDTAHGTTGGAQAGDSQM